MSPHELLVRVPNVNRKGFGETKSELLEQVFVRGACTACTSDRKKPESGSASITERQEGRHRAALGGRGSRILPVRVGSVATESSLRARRGCP